MNPEDQAWRLLQQHASAQLRTGFADRVLRKASGPSEETWAALRAQGAAQIRPGFATRVMRAARNIPGVPSFVDQFAFSLGTAAICIVGTIYFHNRSVEIENGRNIASWNQIAKFVDDSDSGL